jgi:hydroxymethylpyrimidine/phosphomethylpyrimidine kinase
MIQVKSYPIVLSLAGSDSSGRAGIQADLQTFSALAVYAATAFTAITAQNTLGVYAQYALDAQMVYDQICAVVDDLHPQVVKIGMLSNNDIVTAVAEALSKYSLPIILDPVMISTSGHRLLSEDAQEALKRHLLPLATLVTPNIPEMMALTAMPLTTFEDKHRAAHHLMEYGATSVLLKGGHEEGDTKSDILFSMSPSGVQSTIFSSQTIQTRNTHGTGCTLSSAIAAYIARGSDLHEAVALAKEYVTEAILSGSRVRLGEGFGPVNHGYNPKPMMIYDVE